ncbi:carbohydrate ABC transporter permease [Roseateles chitinivorans]|uniref:carbohydrate ABC transporter permease n=1 Tax=Roseateles chitinivorans TaxID=2917965 RepID=UPI003D670E32
MSIGRSVSRSRSRSGWAPWLFLAPALLVFTWFKFIPMVKGLVMSVHKVNFGGADTYVGWHNFERVLGDAALRDAAGRTLLYVVVTVLLSASIALLLAQALQGTARHMRFIRTAMFLPAVTSAAVAAEIWRILYAPTPDGVVNTVIGLVGIGPQGFWADPSQALAALVGMHVWKHVPYDTVIFVAGLAGINSELYDAAAVDGANAWQRFTSVTLPGLAPAVTVICTLGFIRGFRVFTEVYATTGGGPAGSTEVVMTQIYKQGFQELDYGFAAAASTLLFLVTAALTAVYLAWRRRR